MPTPLHLAASLLALSAAVGLAVVALRVSRRPGEFDTGDTPPLRGAVAVLIALGALAFAAGHALSGALVDGAAGVASWLRAGGLLAMVAGVLAPDLGGLVDDDHLGLRLPLPGLGAVVPLPATGAATTAALAGAVAVVRGLVAGRRAVLVGLALGAFGTAELLALRSQPIAALVDGGGALLLGWWLWQRSRSGLRAKFVTASVATVLGVVVVIAVSLSGFGAGDLAEAELDRLRTRTGELVRELGEGWLQEAQDSVAPFQFANGDLMGLEDPPGDGGLADTPGERVQELFDRSFVPEDLLLVLDAGADVYGVAWNAGEVPAEIVDDVAGSAVVREVVAGRELGSQLLVSGDDLFAVAAVRLYEGPPRQEYRGVLVTARLVDQRWVDGVDSDRTAVILEVGDQVSVASQRIRDDAAGILLLLPPRRDRAAVTVDGRVRYAAAADLGADADVDGAQEPIGRVVAVSDARAIATVERDQARRLFLLAVAASALAGLAAGAVSGRLVAPIRRLTQVAEAVREGDLDVSADVDSDDEVGVLGRTFGEMTESLGTQASQLRDAAANQSRLRARLEALNESMGDALVAVDATGRVVTFNPAAEELVGRPAGEVLGARLEDVLRGVGPQGVPAAQAVGPAGSSEVVRVQLVLERPDGSHFPAAATAAPVRDRRGFAPGGRVLVLRDRSREAQVDRMKAEFLANVSHELRTPLTPIRGYAELLARRPLEGEEARAFAERILASTTRLERIVGLIVEFAALDSGSVVFAREPVAVGDLVGSTLADWRDAHPGREFRADLPPDLPPVVVDPALTRRCLDEVLDNAVKFSPGGEPVVVSAFLAGTLRHPSVRLSVADHGVGVDRATLSRVFGDFYQADGTETRAYGGLGLGLALVRRIVGGLGGEVAIDSDPGRGTTVHLDLPVHPSPAAGGDGGGQGDRVGSGLVGGAA